MDDSEQLATPHPPAQPQRPLLGLTILVVEDSRYASEAMRLLCLRSGARIRRADCLRSARRHLQVYRPTAIIIDLGLPDGSGLDLIRELHHSMPRIGIILATSADDLAGPALEAGADGFLSKPYQSLSGFQSEIIARLPPDRRPTELRPITTEQVLPDHMALMDDLELAASGLTSPGEGATLDYLAQFIGALARSAHDSDLASAADRLARACASGHPEADAARVAGLVQDRIQQKRAI
ncbi:response regulator transcription factor [Albibacillus kandeliae]|uniref:response regulator transcription factor n=1 Tax=Albibacillus kandeliae TaxID=2174228 RepID=UPI000D692447|nr:response regulator [Albibacillus kandeliae]